MAAADVHRDFRGIAKQLEDKGCTLTRKGGYVEVRTEQGSKVYSLPGRNQRGGNVHLAERQLANMGLIEAQNGRKPHGHRPPPDPRIKEALREAATRAGHRELSDEELRKLRDSALQDPDDPGRGPRDPRKIGVLRPFEGRRSPMPSMRYIGNAAWGDHVVRRLKKHLEQFDTRRQFVQFAIEVAKDRDLPPPNSRRGARRGLWDEDRIIDILNHLFERKNAKSMTLQFFSAACDELEGIPGGCYVVDENGHEVKKSSLSAEDDQRLIGIQVFADEGDEDAGQSSPVASPEDTSGDQESPEPSTHVDHKQRLAEILLDKLEKGDPVDEALVDRITGLIG